MVAIVGSRPQRSAAGSIPVPSVVVRFPSVVGPVPVCWLLRRFYVDWDHGKALLFRFSPVVGSLLGVLSKQRGSKQAGAMEVLKVLNSRSWRR